MFEYNLTRFPCYYCYLLLIRRSVVQEQHSIFVLKSLPTGTLFLFYKSMLMIVLFIYLWPSFVKVSSCINYGYLAEVTICTMLTIFCYSIHDEWPHFYIIMLSHFLYVVIIICGLRLLSRIVNRVVRCKFPDPGLNHRDTRLCGMLCSGISLSVLYPWCEPDQNNLNKFSSSFTCTVLWNQSWCRFMS